MTEIVSGSNQRRKLEGIPMSNNVVKSRIDDISENILKQVIDELAIFSCSFSVMCFMLMAMKCKKNFCFMNELLLETAKASDVFKKVKNFFVKKILTEKKKKIGSICTNGAPATLKNKSGSVALVKKNFKNNFF